MGVAPGGLPALVRTKMHIPGARANSVPRPRLTGLLAGSGHHRLTFVAAPAGFGKTTALSAWLHAAGLAVAWVSLDEADNDLARFWGYALAALETARPGVAAAALRLLRAPTPPPIASVLTVLLNDFDGTAGPLALVLDDYHLITDDAIHGALTFLIDRLPPELRLVLATRADPPLPLARWRARGELAEVRAADLRFTVAEAAQLLASEVALPLSDEAIAALEGRTEGWAAGLHLAALSLDRRRDAVEMARFVADFAGSHRFVFDYLLEEVIGRLPAETQRFLLHTAPLERLCGPLCDALTGDTNGQALLEQLEREGLFLLPLDDERRWFRYHQLFAETLRARLRATDPALPPALHRRAAAWYGSVGLDGEAVAHALATDDDAIAAPLIEARIEPLLGQGELQTLRRWIDALTAATVAARPRLGLARAWVAFSLGEQGVFEGALRAVEAGGWMDGPGAAAIRDEIAAVRTLTAYALGQLTPAQARAALARLPDDPRWRPLVAFDLGLLHLWDGDLDEAEGWLTRAAAASWSRDDIVTAVQAASGLARARTVRGSVHEAAAIRQEALAQLAARGFAAAPIAALLRVGVAESRYERGDLAMAAREIASALDQARYAGFPFVRSFGHKVLARILQAEGDGAGALAALDEAERACESAEEASGVAALRARLWLRQGQRAAATEWADAARCDGVSVGGEADDPGQHHYEPYEYRHLTLARVLLATDRPDEARRLLDRLLCGAEGQGRIGSSIEILLLRALAGGAGDEGGRRDLARALPLARAGGFFRLVVDEGAAMADALRGLLDADDRVGAEAGAAQLPAALRAYAHELLAACAPAEAAPEPRATTPIPASQPLPEPLSARELDVLRLIAAGGSNRSIADALFVTVGTVKKHLNNIFGKLGATNRTEAVALARGIGLLP